MNPEEIRELAAYAEEHGAHTKAGMLRYLAKQISLFEPVVVAVRREMKGGEYDRKRVECTIRERDEGEYAPVQPDTDEDVGVETSMNDNWCGRDECQHCQGHSRGPPGSPDCPSLKQ